MLTCGWGRGRNYSSFVALVGRSFNSGLRGVVFVLVGRCEVAGEWKFLHGREIRGREMHIGVYG